MKKALFLLYKYTMNPEVDNEKLLDQILKSEIPVPFGEDFAARIVKKAYRQMAMKHLLTELLAYSGVIAGGLLSMLAIVYFFNQESWKKWFDFMTSNLGFLAGGILILMFILLMDRLLLPMLFLRRQESD